MKAEHSSYGSLVVVEESSETSSKTNVPVLVTCFSAALATGGPTYAFGLFGSTLKTALHLTQSQLNTISSANFCAGLLSWIPGLAVDRWGIKIAMIVGGILESIALLLYWLAARYFEAKSTSSHITVPTLSLLGVAIFMSNSLVIGSLFKAIVVCCGSGSKGSAVGAAKGYVGLGAGAYSCLFDAIAPKQASDLNFLPMASVLSIICIVFPAVLLLPEKQQLAHVREVATPTHYRVVYCGLFALALLVVGTSAIFLFEPLPDNVDEIIAEESSEDQGPHFVRALFIILAWFGPISSLLWLNVRAPSASTINESERQRESSVKSEDKVESQALIKPPAPHPVQDYTLVQTMQTAQAWLLLWTCTILVGSGTIMTNNMGQMVEALDFPSRAASACLAMFSVAQAAARVAAGAVSEWASTWNIRQCGIDHGLPRPVFLIVASAFGVLAHSTLAWAITRRAFVTGVVLAGTAFGMVWPLMVLVIGEVFGVTNHGANYMFYDGFTSAVGTLVISDFVTSAVYEAHIDPADAKMDDITCYGIGCFQLSYIITATLCLTCLGTSVAALYLTRHVYDGHTTSRHQKDELFGSPYLNARKRHELRNAR